MLAALYRDNDNLITLDLLKNEISGSYLNAATVTARVLDAGGTQVIAPQALSYVGGSNGKYQASLDKALFASLVINTFYDLDVTAVESGIDYNRRERVAFLIRRE